MSGPSPDSGRAAEAMTQRERALQLEPGNAAVAQQLERARAAR